MLNTGELPNLDSTPATSSARPAASPTETSAASTQLFQEALGQGSNESEAHSAKTRQAIDNALQKMESPKEGPNAERGGTGSSSAPAGNESPAVKSPQANASEQATRMPPAMDSQAEVRAQTLPAGQQAPEARPEARTQTLPAGQQATEARPEARTQTLPAGQQATEARPEARTQTLPAGQQAAEARPEARTQTLPAGQQAAEARPEARTQTLPAGQQAAEARPEARTQTLPAGQQAAEARPEARTQTLPAGQQAAEARPEAGTRTMPAGQQAPEARPEARTQTLPAGQQAAEARPEARTQTLPAGQQAAEARSEAGTRTMPAGQQTADARPDVRMADARQTDPGGRLMGTQDEGADPAIRQTAEPNISGMTNVGVEAAQPNKPANVHAAGQEPRAEISEAARQIADRILVSSPSGSSDGEVRIQLKQTVLEGSDVRIFREHGELKIVIVAQNEFVQRFVSENQAHMLRELGGRLTDERIQLAVEQPQRGRESEQQGNEGRSRQQYVNPDEQED